MIWFVPPVWRLSPDTATVDLPYTNVNNEPLKIGPKETGWTEIHNVSEHLLNSIITSEDARFYQHHGLDFTEIKKSIDKNIRQGRIARGASTITQQVVKMAFLTREKSFIRKAREAVGAMLLEFTLEKDEILEWYVNLAEFGDGIYGIAAASDHYFSAKPSQITIQQAIHLALILPNPRIWSTGLRNRDLTDFGHEQYSQIAGNLRQIGYITEDQWINVLVTGNFGRPLEDYQSILSQYFLEKENSAD